MESKLPKPSGLKRPAPQASSSLKSVLPSDRIKFNNHQFNKDFPPAKVSRIGSPEHVYKPSNLINRSKLRRSRSTCDLRELKTFTKTLPTIIDQKSTCKLSNILNPTNRPKLRRSRSACDVNCLVKHNQVNNVRQNGAFNKYSSKITTQFNQKTLSKSNTAPLIKPKFTNQLKSKSGTSMVSSRKPLTNSLALKPKDSEVKSAANQENSISTITSKPFTISLNKKIPAYDFKAKFNDLLEKHKTAIEKLNEFSQQLIHLNDLPKLYEEAKLKAINFEEKYIKESTNASELRKENQSKELKILSLTENLSDKTEKLEQSNYEKELAIKDNEKYLSENYIIKEENARLLKNNEYFQLEIEASKEQLFNSNIERKQLHNTIMDLHGNIRVFCRVRPALSNELDRALSEWNYLDETSLEISNAEYLSNGNKNKSSSHQFSFDHIFHPRSSQTDVFEMVSPLIQSALDGYNVCIFAYGQTGSGKTFTMDGITENIGIIPRTVDLLFESMKNYKRLGWTYQLKATFLEIYNEVLYDLLSNEAKEMEIRMAKNKTDIYVSNITEEVVENANHLRKLMQIAKRNRATASTVGNERSSRSHAVTKLELIGEHEEKNETSIGTINLIDLAGSESPKTSLRMNETKSINKSLSELTNVILALVQKTDHIPYRNSKLTHLLMPSLGGNSKTLMFINVAPFQDCFGETVKCLRFAASVNSCKMSKAKKNRFLNTTNP